MNVISANFQIEDELSNKGFKDGIEIEKGIILSEERVTRQRKNYEKMCGFFTAYPDLFLDLIKPSESNFEMFFYQRIFLRAAMRYRKVYICAPRAFSKTFLSIIALFLKCVFQPGEFYAHKIFELLGNLKAN